MKNFYKLLVLCGLVAICSAQNYYLVWEPNISTDQVKEYKIYSAFGTNSFSLLSTTTNTFLNLGNLGNGTWTYKAKAVNELGESDFSFPASVGIYNLTIVTNPVLLSIKNSVFINFSVEVGKIYPPYQITDGVLYQTTPVDYTTNGGRAVFTVQIPKTTIYRVKAISEATTGTNDSFTINFDKEPTDPGNICYVSPRAVGLKERTVTWDSINNQPVTWELTKGEHQLIIQAREPWCKIRGFIVEEK